MMHTPLKSDAGFTLAEMAIVLFIVVLLLGGLLVPLSAQIESHNIQATRDTLSEINEALLGFAAAQGRLPCPAQDGATGVESPLGGGTCTNPYARSASCGDAGDQSYGLRRLRGCTPGAIEFDT